LTIKLTPFTESIFWRSPRSPANPTAPSCAKANSVAARLTFERANLLLPVRYSVVKEQESFSATSFQRSAPAGYGES
jgi:hypothetical protein